MNKVLTDNDINWIKSLIFNNNVKYNYEVEIRFLNIEKDIYFNILQYFEKMFKKDKIIKNINEEIKYCHNANYIRRKYDGKEEYIIKKRIKWKFLDLIPANINLSTELICNNSFHINNDFKKRQKKRISFIDKYLLFDFTIIDNIEYNIEIELKNCDYIDKLNVLINGIEKISIHIPICNYINHKVKNYKIDKLIKQPKPLKNKDIIKNDFVVTPKFDGLRSVLYINSENNVFLIKNNFRTIIFTNLICKNINNIFIDGELIDEKIFYAIDIIFYENKDLKDYNIYKRIDLLKSIKFIYKNNNKDIYYKIKKYYFDNIEENSKKIIKKRYTYMLNNKKYKISIDGLIFIEII